MPEPEIYGPEEHGVRTVMRGVGRSRDARPPSDDTDGGDEPLVLWTVESGGTVTVDATETATVDSPFSHDGTVVQDGVINHD